MLLRPLHSHYLCFYTHTSLSTEIIRTSERKCQLLLRGRCKVIANSVTNKDWVFELCVTGTGTHQRRSEAVVLSGLWYKRAGNTQRCHSCCEFQEFVHVHATTGFFMRNKAVIQTVSRAFGVFCNALRWSQDQSTGVGTSESGTLHARLWP